MSDVIPIKCPSCGEILGDKYNEMASKLPTIFPKSKVNLKYLLFDTHDNINIKGLLDELEIKNMCCRTIYITFMNRSDIEAYLSL